MSFESDIFRKKRVVFERLVPFGFQKSQGGGMSSAKLFWTVLLKYVSMLRQMGRCQLM